MKKKIIWILVSCLMVLSLVMASCGPSEEEAEVEVGEEEEIVVEEEEKEEEEEKKEEVKVEITTDMPEYGGMLNMGWRSVQAWDDVYGWEANADILKMTNEELWGGDWAKGPAGTGETDWTVEMSDVWEHKAGRIAESWDFGRLSEGIMVWHIRKGIHWALNPDSEASRLVGGRELTADDVVFTLNEYITNPRSRFVANPVLAGAKITAPDKYTVVIEVDPEGVVASIVRFADFSRIIAHEVLDTYGRDALIDWRNSVGSGPFMVTDYVPDSSVTVVRNPNYWMKDPCGPGEGNQLPYLDGIRFMCITDASTRMAALRTAKIDTHYGGVSWEDALTLKEQRPEMMYSWTPSGSSPNTWMRTDRTDLPFHDVRVRRAMMMAIDFPLINETLYGGYAVINSWPIGYSKDYADAYLSLDDPECPESVKELYSYNPDKARALLEEAGYPEGFKTTVICTQEDFYSVIKEMWAEVDIDLEINVVDMGTWWTWCFACRYDEMMTGGAAGAGTFYNCTNFAGPSTGGGNGSHVNDPYVNEVMAEMGNLMAQGQEKEAMRTHKELMKYVLDQAWAIPTPAQPRITFWWPWLKNYHGEDMVGYHNQVEWAKYVWIDQNLKKSMGY